MRQSILKDVFAGRPVPQDSAGEPADARRARIRAAHDAKTHLSRLLKQAARDEAG